MMELDPPSDLDSHEQEVWERGAKAGIEWMQMLVMSIDVDDTDDPHPLGGAMEQDDKDTCPRCGGELEHSLGAPSTCTECGYEQT